MNKITEGSKWEDETGIEIEVLRVHEEGVMFKYEGDLLDAYSKEDFLEYFTPLPKTHKVFRLWKYLEDEDLTSEQKLVAIKSGWTERWEGKTAEEIFVLGCIVHYNWLVEEEIK